MHAARTDINQAEIVAALRQVGCLVKDVSGVGQGFPDLIVARPLRGCGHVKHRSVVLMEIKSPKGKLNERQKKWHAEWEGYVFVVHSVEEALKAVGIER